MSCNSHNLPLNLIVTLGGAREPIDAVRSITNTSSGYTGTQIVNFLTSNEVYVTSFEADSARFNSNKNSFLKNQFKFSSFDSIHKSIFNFLNKSNSYDWIIHAAALSDYSVKSISDEGNHVKGSRDEGNPHKGNLSFSKNTKISTDHDIQIHLKKNPKLISLISEAFPEIKQIAFKLTYSSNDDDRLKAVQKVMQNASTVEYVISNDLTEITHERHPYLIFDRHLEVVERGQNIDEMNSSIFRLIQRNLKIDSKSTPKDQI